MYQSIATADINNDNFKDIIVGNFGLNSKLAAGKNGPLKLYVKDFDNNGNNESILAYTIDNKEYPFVPKDELEQSIPFIKKKYLYYAAYAGQTINQIFDGNTDALTLSAAQLRSIYLLNDGNGNFTEHPLPDDVQLSPPGRYRELCYSSYWCSEPVRYWSK